MKLNFLKIFCLLFLIGFIIIFIYEEVNNYKESLNIRSDDTSFSDDEKDININNKIQSVDSLLIKVDKNNCLSNDYIPNDLVNISEYDIPGNSGITIRRVAVYDLQTMIKDAKNKVLIYI